MKELWCARPPASFATTSPLKELVLAWTEPFLCKAFLDIIGGVSSWIFVEF